MGRLLQFYLATEHQQPPWWQTEADAYQDISSGMSLSHNYDVIMSGMVSPFTSLTSVYSTVYSGADQRKHQRSASLAFVRGIYRWIHPQRASNAENVSIWWRHHPRLTIVCKFNVIMTIYATCASYILVIFCCPTDNTTPLFLGVM